MMKAIGIAAASLLGFAASLGLVYSLKTFIDQRYEPIDGMVYTFIVGKVEGNDDLLASVLSEDAQGIIKPGRHAFPGAAEEMGERYEIVRYPHLYKKGIMIYEIAFYRPPTGQLDFYNVMVLKKAGGWRIAKNSSFDEQWMLDEIAKEKGKIIHRYREEESK